MALSIKGKMEEKNTAFFIEESLMALEDLFMLVELYSQDISEKDCLMAMECTFLNLAAHTMVSGRKVKPRVKEFWSTIRMIRLLLKVSLRMMR